MFSLLGEKKALTGKSLELMNFTAHPHPHAAGKIKCLQWAPLAEAQDEERSWLEHSCHTSTDIFLSYAAGIITHKK